MLYFLHGTDTHKSREKMHEILQILSAKRANSEIFKLNTENWTEGQFDELLSSQGLFEQKYIVVLDSLFENKMVKDYVLDRLDQMKFAEHWFILLNGKVDVASGKKIEKFSYKSQEFNLPAQVGKKESPVIFSITDKLTERNKKSLWISFVDLIRQGIPVEEIHGVFFWTVKNMILYGTKKYTKEELTAMSSDLVSMTHRVRQGQGELDIMLEKWILRV